MRADNSAAIDNFYKSYKIYKSYNAGPAAAPQLAMGFFCNFEPLKGVVS